MNFAVNLDTVTPAFYNGGMRVEYTRFDVDVVRGMSEQAPLSNRVMEFPQINHKNTGKPYRFRTRGGGGEGRRQVGTQPVSDQVRHRADRLG